MQAAQASSAGGAGAKAVIRYSAAQALVLAPIVCLQPGALDEAIVAAYVNGQFTRCAGRLCRARAGRVDAWSRARWGAVAAAFVSSQVGKARLVQGWGPPLFKPAA